MLVFDINSTVYEELFSSQRIVIVSFFDSVGVFNLHFIEQHVGVCPVRINISCAYIIGLAKKIIMQPFIRRLSWAI